VPSIRVDRSRFSVIASFTIRWISLTLAFVLIATVCFNYFNKH
jgi:hypothetical protein